MSTRNSRGRLLNERKQIHPNGEVEYWRDIPGYEGYYRVSDFGRVKSLTRTVTYSNDRLNRKRTIEGSYVKIFYCLDGRTYVNLWRDNKGKRRKLHHLVLIAFVGPKPTNKEACHFPDREPSNNKLNNLRWGTRSENMKDAVIHGTRFQPDNRGSRGPGAKLTDDDVKLIRSLHKKGFRICEIKRRVGKVTGTAIRYIITGRNWKE